MNFAVGIHFKAKDQVSGVLGRIGRQVEKSANRQAGAFTRVNKSMMSYSKLLGSILTAKVISRGFALAERGATAAVSAYVQMDQSLTSASAKFGDYYQKGREGWKEMTKATMKYGGATEFTNTQVAKGFNEMAKSGLSFQQSIKAFPTMLDFATASETELGIATQTTVDALGAFGLSKAPSQIATSMQRVTDVFTGTANSSTTTAVELAEAMKMSAPHLKRSRVELETWAAIAGTVAKAGAKGTVAATGIKNMILRTVAPTKKAAKILRDLNVQIEDPHTGKLKDKLVILSQIGKAVAGFGEAKQNLIFKELFGMRGLGAAGASFGPDLSKGLQGVIAYREQLRGIGGEAKRIADINRTGLGTKTDILESAALNRGFELINKLIGNKGAGDNIDRLTEWVRNVDLTGTVENIKWVWKYVKWTAEALYNNREAIKWLFVGHIGSKMASSIGLAAYNTVKWVRNLGSVALGMKKIELLQKGATWAQAPNMIPGSPRAGKSVPLPYAAPSVGKAGVGTLLGAGIGGIVTVVASVLASAAVGAAVGYLINKGIETDSASNLNRQNKLVLMTRGSGVNGSKLGSKTDEELRKQYAEGALAYKNMDATRFQNKDEFTEVRASARGMLYSTYQEMSERAIRKAGYEGRSGTDEWDVPNRTLQYDPKQDFEDEMIKRGFVKNTAGGLQSVQPKNDVHVTVNVHGPEGITADADINDVPRADSKSLYALF